ncbi:MAG: peptidylprolyl isomerase [Rhodobacterales bacterium]|nr:MAG: peptidylprolyl isomerase [Rhodobacterales bacterium]
MARGSSTSKTLVWILMALLILGLGGFGVTNLGGSLRSVGAVGEQDISVDDYFRAVQNNISALEAQTGGQISFADAKAAGIDQMALAQLVSTKALEDETARLGISVGDANLRDTLMGIDAFKGLDGSFDREAYRFYLDRQNQSEAEFERSIRAETARGLLQASIVGGTPASPVYADTLLGYFGETRSFTWAALGADDLTTPVPAPDDAALEAFHKENAAQFTLPETRQLTYVWLTPDMILDTVTVDEADLRAEYEARKEEFNQPERRLVERLGFADEAAAETAKIAIEAGEQSFEDVVASRGLELGDVDMGDVLQSDLGEAGPATFSAESGDVVGPFNTDLGPALFRVNAILTARSQSFEEARDALHADLALDRARRVIEGESSHIDDLLAGGATLEEVAEETDMVLATTGLTAESSDGATDYAAFRDEAAKVTQDDFPAVIRLDDGGIAALRLDEVQEPRLQPLADIRDQVAAAWTTAETAKALMAQAETLLPQMVPGADIAALGLTAQMETDLPRTAFVATAPRDLLTSIFAMDPGTAKAIQTPEGAILVRLDAITPVDLADPEMAAAREQLMDQATSDQAQDLLQYFITDVQKRSGIALDQAAINAVNAQFQ